jgi:hypothetical protein
VLRVEAPGDLLVGEREIGPPDGLPGEPFLNHSDPALAVGLLGLDQGALLAGRQGGGPSIPRDGTLLGRPYASLVTLSVRVFAQAAEAEVRQLRLYSGAREVDLTVERPDRRVLGRSGPAS